MKSSSLNTQLCCLFALSLLAACSPADKLVGTKYVSKQKISAESGGTLTITADLSKELAGTVIAIPPGALAQDTEITIAVGRDVVVPDHVSPAGPVVDFGPDGLTFAAPAKVTLPFQLPAGTTVAALLVAGRESNGAPISVAKSSLAVDSAAGTVTFPVMGFTQYGPGARGGTPCDPATNTGCVGLEVCLNGICDSSRCAAAEICGNGVDDDCNGLVDDGCAQTTSCRTPADCIAPQVCDPTTGTCQPPASGSCTTTGCAAGQVCDPVTGNCQTSAPGSCTTTGCAAGQVCDPATGTCQTSAPGSCTTTGCAAGQVCDPTTGTCQPAPSAGLSASPTSIAFGATRPGTTLSANVALTNGGTGALTLTFTLAGPDAASFSIPATSPSQIAGGASATVSVKFAPTVAGARSAQLEIRSTDSAGATQLLQIPLSGNSCTGVTTLSCRRDADCGAASLCDLSVNTCC